MLTLKKILSVVLLAAFCALISPALGCRAQQPPAAPKPTSTAPSSTFPGTPLSVADARRVEVLLREKGNLPPASTVNVGMREPGPFPGFDQVLVTFTGDDGKTSRPIKFLLSTDGKTLAQYSTFDLSVDPRDSVSAEGRPARGGPATAPVLIVGFDDLECPFCARLHASIFPALTARYGDLVHIVYRDYPLTDIHPWAQRAAVDVNCLGAQSTPAYWNAVDYIHAHAGEIGTDPKDSKAEKTEARANEQLDALTREQGTFQKLDEAKLNACIVKQDLTAVNESKKLGDALNLNSAPVLFINGDKIDGAVPIEFIDKIVDTALLAEGKTPPPYPAPPAATAAKK